MNPQLICDCAAPAAALVAATQVPGPTELSETPAPADNAFTLDEIAKFESCDKAIEEALKASDTEVGLNLRQIRDERLFRRDFKTFEQYCKQRWKFSKAHAYRLIRRAGFHNNLSPRGDKLPQPTQERQIRELLRVPAEKVPQVWEIAVKAAGGRAPTARQVCAAAAPYRNPKKAARPAPEECKDLVEISKGTYGVAEDAQAQFVIATSIHIGFEKTTLESEADVDAYLAAVKTAYLAVITSKKSIKL